MSCDIDKDGVVAVVLAAFDSRFAEQFPPAFEQERKLQMRAAFDGRSVQQEATAVEYWTGSWDGSKWSGERHKASAPATVTLRCDGDEITIEPPAISVTTVFTSWEDYLGGNA